MPVDSPNTPKRATQDIAFETSELAVITPGDSVGAGNVVLVFHTPLGDKISTTLGPNLAAALGSQVLRTLAAMPTGPMPVHPAQWPEALKGGGNSKVETRTFFGQSYNSEMLTVVGLIIVRASILESALVRLLASLSNMGISQSEAVFYSTQNNKARLDLIRALIPHSGISETSGAEIAKTLDRAGQIAGRRNIMVHGEWEFKQDKFIVREKRPLPTIKAQEPIATVKSLMGMASEFYDCGRMVSVHASTVVALRMALNT